MESEYTRAPPTTHALTHLYACRLRVLYTSQGDGRFTRTLRGNGKYGSEIPQAQYFSYHIVRYSGYNFGKSH